MPALPRRIAMWSGPRNISTAMLRAWGSRADTAVCDEPFYAHYLVQTGLPHPGADEVIAAQENDWRKVVAWLLGPVPQGRPIFYQKHMAHHLLPGMDRGWLERVTNCFLIREPREMLTSLLRFIPRPTLADTGLPQQVEIFAATRARTGSLPAVVDARDVLEDPRRMLTRLCEAIDVPFDEAMRSWAPGLRETDGVWAKHWYAQVAETTTFGPYRPKDEAVPDELLPLLAECETLYRRLHAERIT